MLAEILEQPRTLQSTLDRYTDGDRFREEACAPARAWLRQSRSMLTMAASGSSRHACMVAALAFADRCGIAAEVQYASEFIYRRERANAGVPVLVVSQSGETADTLAALRHAEGSGRATLAITNVEGSSMDSEAANRMPTVTGRERAVPATKSFTAQLLALHLLTLLAEETVATTSHTTTSAVSSAINTSAATIAALAACRSLASRIEAQLDRWQATATAAAKIFATAQSALFLGRGAHFPIALEGALKLAETAYIPAQGMPGGELKHGPNALVDPATPLVMLMTHDPGDEAAFARYERMLALLEDMHAQGATVVAVANADDRATAALTPHVIPVETAPEALLPLLTIIPLQMLAYRIAVDRGLNIDRPRNLSKAVLSE
jgi:glucosamine--fructose-6-phosphate aminotransferase (isomerizing)